MDFPAKVVTNGVWRGERERPLFEAEQTAAAVAPCLAPPALCSQTGRWPSSRIFQVDPGGSRRFPGSVSRLNVPDLSGIL